MTRSRRGLVMAAGAVLALALVVVLVRPAPVGVEVARARRGPLRVTVDEEGKTRVRDRFVLTAPVAGRVERISLRQGDTVELGALAARIHPAPLDPRTRAEATARLEAAEAEERAAGARVEQAHAALAQARRAGRRAHQLAQAGTLSAAEREVAELAETTQTKELAAATFAARAAAHNVQAASAALLTAGGETAALVPCGDSSAPCLELRSPIGGRVLRLPEQSERVVAAGTPLLELGDPGALEIVVDLLSEDAVKVRPGAPVLIDDWGGEGTLHARVRLIEPSGFTKLSALGVEEQRVNLIADFIDPPAALGDGYRVEARIAVWEAEAVLQIPATALFRRAGVWNVFLLEGGKARRTPVELGHRGTLTVEVLNGLADGATLILHPNDQIADGVRVKPLARWEPEAAQAD
ncbi:MAG: HlyD family efflux transporter periplasmic adaptor subunit [Deltaproteobacteria bacterium]|nr:HlyD family efflux transporter periplasmic adaptor subunit [Deltaproteobacteria bacterium]